MTTLNISFKQATKLLTYIMQANKVLRDAHNPNNPVTAHWIEVNSHKMNDDHRTLIAQSDANVASLLADWGKPIRGVEWAVARAINDAQKFCKYRITDMGISKKVAEEVLAYTLGVQNARLDYYLDTGIDNKEYE